ncbi:MAG: RtcB family protein [Myxococcota bacterium]
MDSAGLIQQSPVVWRIEPEGEMRVPTWLYVDSELLRSMNERVRSQVMNVAALPGIVGGVHVMPDGHWGYGFPIGSIAVFDPDRGGVVSAGGVGFDIACGVRCLHTNLHVDQVNGSQARLAEALFRRVPAGVGASGVARLDGRGMDDMLHGGARWAVEQGWGEREDLERIEERGCCEGAAPEFVSREAMRHQQDQMGSLGAGNHYLEVQHVTEIHAPDVAERWGLSEGDVVVCIHVGSRGLGHQIGTDYLREMLLAAKAHGLALRDRELACAPIDSALGRRYLGAMRAAANCAVANRQIITHLTRQAFARVLPGAELPVLYDLSHNTCREEVHLVDGVPKRLVVHRKGATRAFGPGHPELPEPLRSTGQPVLVGGSMGAGSWILAGTTDGMGLAFGSACHGAGRRMSRHAAKKRWHGREVIRELARRGVIVKGTSWRGIAEEAPGAYRDVDNVVNTAHEAGLARKVARLEPMICVKG